MPTLTILPPGMLKCLSSGTSLTRLIPYNRATRTSVMGGMNYHIDVRFDDGIIWIARIRRINATSPPPALRDYILRSEAATLLFLDKTAIPAPKVHDFALENPNPKQPCRIWFHLDGQVMDQLADTFVEFQKYPFDLLGSLDSPGGSQVGAGPFSSLQEYHASSIQLILDLIVRDEMYSQQAVDACLIHQYLIDLVPHILPAVHVDEEFYLKHADDKGYHILVHEHFTITGIIDWEWAHTASPAHAL
ncbi:hypothetical protein QX201_004464 [Fusarium graminearum]